MGGAKINWDEVNRRKKRERGYDNAYEELRAGLQADREAHHDRDVKLLDQLLADDLLDDDGRRFVRSVREFVLQSTSTTMTPGQRSCVNSMAGMLRRRRDGTYVPSTPEKKRKRRVRRFLHREKVKAKRERMPGWLKGEKPELPPKPPRRP